jgi:hypothetical protein
MNPYLQDILHNITTRLAKLEEQIQPVIKGETMTQEQLHIEEKTNGTMEVVSLRDYYAARILQGLVEKHGASYLYETIREAFRMADAALVIREEKSNG